MRITFIGHASLLVEAGGLCVLSDPWWRGPCFGAQWWLHPAPFLEALEGRRIDYLYISHGHHDHFHSGTLATFPRDTKVLMAKGSTAAPAVSQMGFDVVEVGADEAFPLGANVTCRIMETQGGDTLCAIAEGDEICVNLNDSLHAASDEVQDRFIGRLASLYPVIDYLFCGYGVASHFPNCYVIPGKNREQTAIRRQRYFNRRWARVVEGLKPRFAFPFAADVVFLEDDLCWVNRPTHDNERPTEAFAALSPRSEVSTFDIAPGFTIDRGHVVHRNLRTPLSDERLLAMLGEAHRRANRYGSADDDAVREICALLERSRDLASGYLRSYDGRYRFLIRLRNARCAIAIDKRDGPPSVTMIDAPSEKAALDDFDLVYTTRAAYLRRALTEPFGNEILFVGSGGIFQYRERPLSGQQMNRELIHLLTRREHPSPLRFGGTPRSVVRAKRMLKRLVRPEAPDLYDVAAWTVFADEGEWIEPVRRRA
ncbi:MAG TPA: MBL fold metallo-hydrolase [Casimicrobiaceae bacterium]|nr:MBL fold metallo-hydrolase [Casimicrobiaceae bacterium]